MKSDNSHPINDDRKPVSGIQALRWNGLYIALTILLLTTLACSFSVDFSEGSLSVNSGDSSLEEEGDTAEAQDTDIPTDAPAAAQSTETASPPPTQTRTPTPESVMLGVSQDTFCRTGPSSDYPEKSILNTDQTSRAVARDPGETSWLIVNPDNESEECWIWGRYATPRGLADSLARLHPAALADCHAGFRFLSI